MIALELLTDLFNPFSLDFLGALEHLSGIMDVIYIGQLSPAWVFVATRLANFPKFDEFFISYMVKFYAEESSKQKTLKYQELTKNPTPKLGSNRYIYTQFYIYSTPEDIWSVFGMVIPY